MITATEAMREQLQLFVRRFGLLNAACCDECCGERVSMAQSHILCELRRRPGSPMQRVAEELGLDVTTFSRQVKGLVARGLVARSGATEDRRVSLLRLTPAGAAVLARIDSYLAERLQHVFARMTGFEQETVNRSLELLNQALATAEGAGSVQEGTVACCK